MVSYVSLISMGTAGIACILFPIIVFLYFRKKDKIKFKPVLVGMLVFIIFVLILERALHMAVIGSNLIPDPVLFSIYGALAAGIFEETGRFIAFKTVLKNNYRWKDGISYGIGHGGIEAILIGGLAYIQFMFYGILINNGTFEKALGSNLTASQLQHLNQLKTTLIQTNTDTIIIGVLERVFAFGIQIALTMIVLYAVRYRKNIYLLAAILLHALIDVPAALYQMKIITNLYIVESIILLYFVVSLIFIVKTKSLFTNDLDTEEIIK